MPRGGSRSSVEKKKRSEDEELERAFLQIEARQSPPSKRQRGGQRNLGCSTSSLHSPCRIRQADERFESSEEQKSETNHMSSSSIVKEIDAKIEKRLFDEKIWSKC